MNRRGILLTLGLFLITAQMCLGFGISVMSKANGCYVHKQNDDTYLANRTGVGTWGMFDQQLISGNTWALKSYGNDKYLHVYQNGLVKADATSCNTTDTQFEFVSTADGWLAMKCVANQCYLSTYYNTLYAWRPTIASDCEKFQTTFRVDIWQAVTAFANSYPSSLKAVTETPDGAMMLHKEEMHNGEVWMYELFADYRFSPIGHPVWNAYGLQWVGDWETFCCYETQPMYQTGSKWWYIPRCLRYLAPFQVCDTQIASCAWYDFYVDGTTSYLGSYPEWGRSYVSRIKDLGYDIGSRWVVDVGYKDDSETWCIDLGPASGNFAPAYGIVGYRQHYFGDIQNDHDVIAPRSGFADY